VWAWANFDKLRQLTLETHSVPEIVDSFLDFGDGLLAPIQIREEIVRLGEEVRALRPRYILEIGTAAGGTLFLWTRVAHPLATLVTIDLPGGPFGGGSSILKVPLYHRMAQPGQQIHTIRANSHLPETVERAKRCLDGHLADFLFIDADHTEQGVRTDFSLYAPLVRDGGLIAFHDIAITRPEYGVRTLWKELKSRYRSVEFLGEPLAFGIGAMWKHGSDQQRAISAAEGVSAE
jgi:predicted O-methyltransferase YrrM